MTRQVFAGRVAIGGGAPVSVQTMTNTDTRDVEATLNQIHAMAEAGADIVRVSVYDEACAEAVRALVDGSPVPLVADIHFNHRLAIRAIENGISPKYVVGSKETIRPSIGRYKVTGQVSAYFEDSYLLEKFINEASSSLVFTLTGDIQAGQNVTLSIGQKSANYDALIPLSGLREDSNGKIGRASCRERV